MLPYTCRPPTKVQIGIPRICRPSNGVFFDLDFSAKRSRTKDVSGSNSTRSAGWPLASRLPGRSRRRAVYSLRT